MIVIQTKETGEVGFVGQDDRSEVNFQYVESVNYPWDIH